MIITERFECPHCGAIYRLKREKVSGVDDSARAANIEVGGANIFGSFSAHRQDPNAKKKAVLTWLRRSTGEITVGRIVALYRREGLPD